MFIAKLYFSSLLLFTIVDVVWLKVIASGFFTSKIGHLMTANPQIAYAAVFYLLYPLALIYLVFLSSSTPTEALLKGFVLGAACYGTYELTNMTVLKDWPVSMVLVDTLWGTFLTGIVCYLVFRIV